MQKLKIKTNPNVDIVYKNYPEFVRSKLKNLRQLIIDSANETEGILYLEETLKWGEPSYLTKGGSTIRIDWKSKLPNQYAMYFKCTSRLVETFRSVFPDTFNYEGKREIVFKIEDKVPIVELKQCIKAALTYHKVKHMHKLGIIKD